MFKKYNEITERLRDEYVEVNERIAKLEVAISSHSFVDEKYKELNELQLEAMQNYACLILSKIEYINSH